MNELREKIKLVFIDDTWIIDDTPYIDKLEALFSTELEKEIIKELKWVKAACAWRVERLLEASNE
jgi:radical SAM superfamily enzyme YgiQ (UPF0313 family)